MFQVCLHHKRHFSVAGHEFKTRQAAIDWAEYQNTRIGPLEKAVILEGWKPVLTITFLD